MDPFQLPPLRAVYNVARVSGLEAIAAKKVVRWYRHPLTLTTFATLLFGVVGWVFEGVLGSHSSARMFYAFAYVTGGWHSTLAGLRALRHGEIDVDLLMVLAAVGAAVLGFWHEGVVLLFLFSLSNTLQNFALDSTRQAVARMMDLRPDRALVRRDGSDRWISVDELVKGDTVIVRPGDRIPADGIVDSGASSVDMAAVTGESTPVDVSVGDAVFAGTLNQHGVLVLKVTHTPEETMLARILRLVEKARQQKAATQEKLERFEQRYAWIVLGLAAAAIVLPILLGEPLRPTVYRALTLMVVASPCAVAIAAPAGFLSAISAAARSGVLIKGGRYLERLADVKIVAFDKTGTLTWGKPRVVAVVPAPLRTVTDVLTDAAAVEAHSEHPLAQAIRNEAKRRGIPIPAAQNVQNVTGQGIQGLYDGRVIRIGRLDFFSGTSLPGRLADISLRLQQDGHTVVWVGDPHPYGLIALRDTIRPHAAEMIRRLRALGISKIVMLTGDNEAAAHFVARRLGIDVVHAELLPEDKVRHLEELSREGTVAMVGDGVNDAPALARSHVGVAMGAVGSDVALETADVVLVSDELLKLPEVFVLARNTRRVVLQGLSVAVSVIGVLLVATLLGWVTLSTGVLGHEGSTVIVVLNGLRLLLAPQRMSPSTMERHVRQPPAQVDRHLLTHRRARVH